MSATSHSLAQNSFYKTKVAVSALGAIKGRQHWGGLSIQMWRMEVRGTHVARHTCYATFDGFSIVAKDKFQLHRVNIRMRHVKQASRIYTWRLRAFRFRQLLLFTAHGEMLVQKYSASKKASEPGYYSNKTLHARGKHQAISNRDYHSKSHDTAGYSACNKMFHL